MKDNLTVSGILRAHNFTAEVKFKKLLNKIGENPQLLMRGNIELIKHFKISLGKCVSHLHYRGGHLQWNATQNDTDDGCSIGGEQPLDLGPGNWIFTQKSILKEHMQ